MRTRSCVLGFAWSLLILFLAVSRVAAYDKYHPGNVATAGDGCFQCHGWNDDLNPVAGTDATSPFRDGGFDEKGPLHKLHDGMINGHCQLCHTSSGDSPYTYTSGTAGESCRGCHGVDPNPQGDPNFNWGAGLRLQHANAGVPADLDGNFCATCHTDDPLPVPEDTVPVYYPRTEVKIDDPCNADGSEDWDGDGFGLDNDGDLAYDGADLDCVVCATNADCDDGNPCTDDVCDQQTAQCSNPPNSAPCDDGDACTTEDACSQGSCVGGSPLDCEDGNVCTEDSCDAATGCVNDGTGITVSCDDGDACTENEVCQGDAAGTCGGGGAVDCDDGNVCTADSCDSASGCINDGTGITVSCDDADLCTENDVCQGDAAGTCGGGAVSCDDGVSCTDDSCEAAIGCVNTPNDANCPDDGLFCNGAEFCDSVADCSSGGDPCPPGAFCNESTDTCEGVPQVLLTVDKLGGGEGTVTSDPAGIDCGAACSQDSYYYAVGTEVGLTATRGAASTFEGWGEACSGTTLATGVTMDADKTCTAEFEACVEVKDVSGQAIGDEQYFEGCTTLFASAFQVAGPGGLATLLAGLEVVLGEGFEVLTDGTLVIGNDASLLP